MIRSAGPTVAFVLALGLAPPGRAADEVALDALPPKVTAAVRAKFPKGELKEATKEAENGVAHYTVTLNSQGTHYDVTATEDGKVTEVAKEIAYKDLPKAVAAAFRAKYPRAEVQEVAELTEPGVAGKKYHVEAKTPAGKEVKLTYDPAGKLVEEE